MKPISFTSDWHIGHEAILNFSNRPFQSIDEMERALIVRYNNTVPKNGICYFLGDMGWGDKKRLSNVIKQLHGTKVLILGNHDRGMTAMYEVGFDVILYSGKLLIGNHTVTMSHCPLLGVKREDTSEMRGAREGEAWHGENRHGYKFSLKDEGQFHLHGHIHSPNAGRSQKILDRQYDVGVDANNYTPVSLKTIQSWITKTLQKG